MNKTKLKMNGTSKCPKDWTNGITSNPLSEASCWIFIISSLLKATLIRSQNKAINYIIKIFLYYKFKTRFLIFH